MATRKITADEQRILDALNRTDKAGDAFVGRAVFALFERQTAAEQQIGQTVHHNGVGFSGCDAEILTSFAKFWKKAGFLTTKQLALARKKLPKYRKQLAVIAAEKAAQKAEAEAKPMPEVAAQETPQGC